MNYRVPIDESYDGSVFLYAKEICRTGDIVFNICHCQGRTFYETQLGAERYFYRSGSPAFMLFCEFQSLRLTGDFLCEYDPPGWTELGDMGRSR